MPLTLLLDLDDTLLDTNMGAFLPAYYEALAKHLAPLVPPTDLLEALHAGVRSMSANADPALTLQEVFRQTFYARLVVERKGLERAIADFYHRIFPSLGLNSKPMEGSRQLIDWALAAGHQLVLATDPLFPMAATAERVRWAGLQPASFSLISTFETFHFSKSQVAYYAELLGRIGWPEGQILMVGNDVERDLVPARSLGLAAYRADAHSVPARQSAPGEGAASADWPHGDLTRLLASLESGECDASAPSLESRSAILAVLRATPAVLKGLSAGLTDEGWRFERAEAEWAMIELVCHLRDTEREVHADQIRTLMAMPAPFVARPDAAVWAKQRRYLNEDGPAAIREFLAARLENLAELAKAPDEMWNKPARHAIFGPSTFQEVIGFVADHDRLHLQQAWSILHPPADSAHRP